MSWQSDFYGSVYSTAKELGATDTQAHLAASQASQETGFGKHVVGNNYFGVKASPSYEGETVEAGTTEVENGQTVSQNAAFRAYDGLKASVANYMDVMASSFPDAWSATNIADAAKGLVSGKFGTYATDPNYGSKINSIAGKFGAQQKFAYAQEPDNVPVPYGPQDDPFGQSIQAQATEGLPGLLNPVTTQDVATTDLAAPGEWGVINGVAPVTMPTVESWSAMAAADPVQAPTQPAGLLGVDNWSTLASAQPVAAPVSGLLGSNPTISQTDINRALTNTTAINSLDPSFTAGLMSPQNPVVPTAVETTSFTPDMAPAVEPAVATGIYSPEHLAVQAQAQANLDRALAERAYTAQPAVSPAEAAVTAVAPAGIPTSQWSSLATPGIANQASQYGLLGSTLAASGVTNLTGQTLVGPTGVATSNIPTIAAPALDAVQIAEQPSVAEQPTIAGPASSVIAPAAQQQQVQQAVAQAPSLGDKLKSAVNPGTAIGGLLGGATMGPIGGLLGGLLGNSINSGSLSGLLGGQPPAVTSLGYGPQAVYGAYGASTPGISGIASNGATVTSQGNGWTTYTSADGVTNSVSPWGGGAGWFGGDPDTEADADASV